MNARNYGRRVYHTVDCPMGLALACVQRSLRPHGLAWLQTWRPWQQQVTAHAATDWWNVVGSAEQPHRHRHAVGWRSVVAQSVMRSERPRGQPSPLRRGPCLGPRCTAGVRLSLRLTTRSARDSCSEVCGNARGAYGRKLLLAMTQSGCGRGAGWCESAAALFGGRSARAPSLYR